MLRLFAAACIGTLLATGIGAAGPVDYGPADELTDFNAAIETAASHNRVALGYLRTENVDLASLELERMHTAWIEVMRLYGQNPPAAFRTNPRYAATLHEVRFYVTTAIAMLSSGQFGKAREALETNRRLLHELRQASGIEVLADCVMETNAAMARFFVFDAVTPDLAKPEVAANVANKAAELAATAKRCDGIAPPEVRANPEFRRLLDGIAASLAYVPTAVNTRDVDMLHRVIGELRAFDQLLTFRYG
jgi:hypothetical protein